MHELRCDNQILFGTLDGTVLEVRCRSNRCGKEPGVIIIHRFSLLTGDLVGTKKYRDPAYKKGGQASGTRHESPLRSA